MNARLLLSTACVVALGAGTMAFAHEGDATAGAVTAQAPPSAAILQLEMARQASARFHDVAQAEAEGYVDIGLFIPNMGWHYLKNELVDAEFDPTQPELLVYADNPCGGPRRLVAVEYAVPLALSRKAPAGFSGTADVWAANTTFQLWTLHAWVWEYNPEGVFSPMNVRVQ